MKTSLSCGLLFISQLNSMWFLFPLMSCVNKGFSVLKKMKVFACSGYILAS